jgi:succinate-acetate transporter protein
MTGCAIKVFVYALCMCILDLDMAVLAVSLTLHVTHAFLARGMTVDAMDILLVMDIRGHTFGK